MKINAFLYIGLILIASACPDQDPFPDSEIKIINNSNNTILHLFHSDTLLPENNYFNSSEQLDVASIHPNDSAIFPGFYKNHFSQGYKELILFLFNKDTVISNDWETIVNQYLILKRYDLTLSSLDSLSWTIKYAEH